MDERELPDSFEETLECYKELRAHPERIRSWTDSLDDKWNAYVVTRTDTREEIATVYREDLAFEFVKMLNEKFSIPAWWTPDIGAGLRKGQ